jgi:hypothetical protein
MELSLKSGLVIELLWCKRVGGIFGGETVRHCRERGLLFLVLADGAFAQPPD